MRELQRHGEHKEKANEISQKIVGRAIAVHREWRPGLLESAYEGCLKYELKQADLAFKNQAAQAVSYKVLSLECGYRLDLLVENLVIVKLEAVETLLPIHDAQLLTYLRLRNKRLGLFINSNLLILKQGIKRIVNSLLNEPPRHKRHKQNKPFVFYGLR